MTSCRLPGCSDLLKTVCLSTMLIVSSNLAAAEFKLPENRAAGITIADSALPKGPDSIRVIDDFFWITDSHGSRLLRSDSAAKIIKTDLTAASKKAVPGDMAAGRDAKGDLFIWVVNRAAKTVIRLDKRGQPLMTIGPVIRDRLEFSEIKYAETDGKGNVYIGDVGHQKIFVFDSAGKLTKEHAWSKTAFCLDGKDRLHTASPREGGWQIEITDPATGKTSTRQMVGLKESAQPHLWGFSRGRLVFSAWAGGPVGRFVGLADTATGQFETQGSLGEIPAMTRFLAVDSNGNLWRAVERYEGNTRHLLIIKLDLDGGSEG